jgi:thiol-disulfide isomerase/thioredoxin
MAGRRGLKQLVDIIEDAETLQAWIEKSEEILVGESPYKRLCSVPACNGGRFCSTVVDLYKEWCGYCSVMEPTYNSLFNELDDFDNRVKLLAVGGASFRTVSTPPRCLAPAD